MDLSKILKNHEGEIFYSALFGDVRLTYAEPGKKLIFQLVREFTKNVAIIYDIEGKYLSRHNIDNQIPTLFPSKENHDWEKWEKECPVVEPAFKVGQYAEFINPHSDITSRYQIVDISIDKEETYVHFISIQTGCKMIITESKLQEYIEKGEFNIYNNIKNILKPFDKVLIRVCKTGHWSIDFYSHATCNMYKCAMHSGIQKGDILPYYPNQHLLNIKSK